MYFALNKTWSFLMEVNIGRVAACELLQSSWKRVFWNQKENCNIKCCQVWVVTCRCMHGKPRCVDVWGVCVYFLSIHMQLVSAGYGSLCLPSVSPKWNYSRIHLTLKLFSNISIVLEQIYIFKTDIIAELTYSWG